MCGIVYAQGIQNGENSNHTLSPFKERDREIGRWSSGIDNTYREDVDLLRIAIDDSRI